ncbi:MAG: T9SS type A sorting domain-containing protein [Bacteroidota bacterium]
MNQTLGINWDTGDLFHNFGSNIVDTVTVLIRSTIPPTYIIEATFNGVNITTNGSIPTIYLNSNWSSCPYGAITGYHHIVIKHRNSIETWSDSVDFSGQQINYNFFTHTPVEFAGGMYEDGNGNFEIWGGDVNQNGNLESIDYSEIYLAANSTDPTVNTGYVLDDIDGNGNIDSQDYGLAYNNANLGANIINPEIYQAQPTSLTLTPYFSTVTGSFSASETADHYLIVRSSSGILGASPVKGTIYTSGNTIGNGVVVAYQVGTSFIDTNLSKGTYYYYIFTADTLYCTHNYLTTAPLAASVSLNCGIPLTQASNLILTKNNTTLNGSFTASTTADHYLIVRSTSDPLTATPASGTTYSAGSPFGDGTVVAYQTATTFVDSNLYTCTQYYYTIFAANCTGSPQYLTSSPLKAVNILYSAVDITTIKDTTYFVSSNATWVNFIATHDTCTILFKADPCSVNIFGNVYMYSGNCDSLTLINTYTMNDTIRMINFTNLNIGTNYYFEVEFNNILNNLFHASIFYLYRESTIICPSDCSNLIVNGNFECYDPNYDPLTDSYPFTDNYVPQWNRGWGFPNIKIGTDNNSLNYHYSAHLTSEEHNCQQTGLISGDCVYQDLSAYPNDFVAGMQYELTFDYYKDDDYNHETHLNVNLSYFDPQPLTSDATPSFPSNLPLQMDINFNYPAANDYIWHHSNPVVFTYPSPQLPHTPTYLTFYAKCDEVGIGITQKMSIYIDNVVIKPKINLSLSNTTVCPGSPTTITATLPSNITNPIYYLYDNTGVLIASSTTNFTVYPTTATTYTVKTTVGNCQYTGTIDVSVYPLMQPQIVGNNNDCDAYQIPAINSNYHLFDPSYTSYLWSMIYGGTIQGLDNSSTVAVLWSNVNGVITNATPGVLKVVVTDEHGCINIAYDTIYDCCWKDKNNDTNLYNQTITSSSQIPTGNYFFINGTVIFDCDVTIHNQTIYFGPNANIVVPPNRSLTIERGSLLTAGCNFMWDGIEISENPIIQDQDMNHSLFDMRNSTLEYSIKGVYAFKNANVNIESSTFQYNKNSCVSLTTYLPLITGQTLTLNFIQNSFIGGQLIFPFANSYSEYGIKVTDVTDVTIGDITSVTSNKFDNLYCGIYGYNAHMKIYNNIFTNIKNNNSWGIPPGNTPIDFTQVNSPFGIFSAHPISTQSINTTKEVIIGGTISSIPVGNTFDNCANGIGIYNERADILNNDIRTLGYGIFFKEPLNFTSPLNITNIKSNNIEQFATNCYTQFGIQVINTLPSQICVNIQANTITATDCGIRVGFCAPIISHNTIHLKGFSTCLTLLFTDIVERFGIRVERSPNSIITCNTIDNNPASQGTDGLTNFGISIARTSDATVNENTISYFGAGINIYDNCTDTKFGCNVLQSDFYGFLFNSLSNISGQGNSNLRSDNQFVPDGSYTSGSGGNAVERKLWKNFSSLVIGSNINWWVRNTTYKYDLGITSNHPLYGIIFPYTIGQVAPSTCNLGCIDLGNPSPSGPVGYDDRESLFGAIVRNQDTYPELETQFKAYNRYVLYKLLQANDSLIYMGDTTDYLYEDFYKNTANGNIGLFDSIYYKIAMGDVDAALVNNNAIQDTSLIDYNQQTVNNIYLNTFAVDNYQLDTVQYQTLHAIATNYTPWEGGDAVYIARYMLGIDIDLSNPNVLFSKGHQPPIQVEIPFVISYPNPASDRLNLQYRDAIEGGYVIDVYNYLGKKVISEKVSQIEAEHILNTISLNNGLYIYNITTTNNIFKGKFTIIK